MMRVGRATKEIYHAKRDRIRMPISIQMSLFTSTGKYKAELRKESIRIRAKHQIR